MAERFVDQRQDTLDLGLGKAAEFSESPVAFGIAGFAHKLKLLRAVIVRMHADNDLHAVRLEFF